MTSRQTPVVTVILGAVACACRTVLLTGFADQRAGVPG